MNYYVINTDQNAIDDDRKAKGLSTCDLWFAYRMAFAGDEKTRGKHAKLFEKVLTGDALFMYRSSVGRMKGSYVGVGIVQQKWDKRVHEGNERFLYTKEAYEYRIDVQWLRDWRQSPRTAKDAQLPQPRGGTQQRIDEHQYPQSAVYASNDAIQSMEEYNRSFEEAVTQSLASSDEARRKRIEAAPSKPRKITVLATIYERNPDVVVQVLKRAKGLCERCGKPAPFIRMSDGSPYLEVHHIEMLASGGLDTEANAQALCPNCHRKAHYGR